MSIIIPFKNENDEQIGMALSSINNQINVDFNRIEVILVNDGRESSVDLLRFSIFKNLTLRYYEIENMGPGLARQYGIDHSSSEYLMFVDADEIFFHSMALQEFFKVYNSKKHDIIIGRVIEQYKDLEENFHYHIHDVKNWNFRRFYGKRKNLNKLQ